MVLDNLTEDEVRAITTDCIRAMMFQCLVICTPAERRHTIPTNRFVADLQPGHPVVRELCRLMSERGIPLRGIANAVEAPGLASTVALLPGTVRAIADVLGDQGQDRAAAAISATLTLIDRLAEWYEPAAANDG
jgi:hypothetical protein